LDRKTAELIAAAVEGTKFGEVILVMHEGRVIRIDTHIRLIAWSTQSPLDSRTEKGDTVD